MSILGKAGGMNINKQCPNSKKTERERNPVQAKAQTHSHMDLGSQGAIQAVRLIQKVKP
jgi:hypothetical protein